jgi:hypothetical protein
VARDLVAYRRADQVGAVGIEALLHQQVDLSQVDVADVDGDLLVDGPGGREGGTGTSGWHVTMLAPSKWMFSPKFRNGIPSYIAAAVSPMAERARGF